MEALRRARAPFVARLDAGGRLAPLAAARIAAALADHPDARVLYTDEVNADFRGLEEIVLKPAFDPVLLEAFDYIGRLAVYARRVLALGGWGRRPTATTMMALRFAAAAPAGAILHLPYPAYIGAAV